MSRPCEIRYVDGMGRCSVVVVPSLRDVESVMRHLYSCRCRWGGSTVTATDPAGNVVGEVARDHETDGDWVWWVEGDES